VGLGTFPVVCEIFLLIQPIKKIKICCLAKPGGLHVFSRHTPATLMVAHGCDIFIVQKILRHNDIKTTLRYAHVNDKTQREAYEKFLTL